MRKRSVVATDGQGSEDDMDSFSSEDDRSSPIMMTYQSPIERPLAPKSPNMPSPSPSPSPVSACAAASSTYLCQQQYERNVKQDIGDKSDSNEEGIERARDIDIVCGRGRGNFVSDRSSSAHIHLISNRCTDLNVIFRFYRIILAIVACCKSSWIALLDTRLDRNPRKASLPEKS